MNSILFPYIQLRLRFQLRASGELPEQKASMLRGVIARIVRHSVCHDFDLPCKQCGVINICTYPAIFESPDIKTSVLNRGGTVPHPYIIRCSSTKTSFRAGDLLEVEVLLLGGHASAFASHIYEVLPSIIHYPLGKDRIAVSVQDVCQVNEQGEAIHLSQDTYSSMRPSVFQSSNPDGTQLRIMFRTPLRIIRQGNLLRHFKLDDFLWQVKHRYAQLALLYSTESAQVELNELPSVSSDCIVSLQESWKEVRRFSNRQQKSIAQNGVIANIELSLTDELRQWLPYLQFCELFHVGKATSFGLGQYELWYR